MNASKDSSILLGLLFNIAKMEILQDDTMRELYNASLNGSVSSLRTLIQRDPLILSKVSLYPFSETPLHIASLLGNLEFCQILLDIDPNLAAEVNLEGRCPLHLASAKGYTEIVRAILLTNPKTSLIRDKDDKLPLHFAAMRGRVEAIKELNSVMSETEIIKVMSGTDDHGSILHLCVRHNHLEALKILVQPVTGENRLKFLSTKDKEGNTVLHLAVRRTQIKIIKYLLSLSEMSTTVNTFNNVGLTPLDMLDHSSRDFISLTIERILTKEGAQRSKNTVTAHLPTSSSTQINIHEMTMSQNIASAQQDRVLSPHNDPPQSQLPPTQTSPRNSQSSQTPSINNQHGHGGWNMFENFCTTYLINQGNWIDKKTKEQFMVAATVIATMTFQSVISPPGGVWQEDTKHGNHACTTYDFCEAGTAVVGYVWSPDFMKFIFFNSASFFASLCVVLVLISGFPLGNKVIMGILAVLMIIAVTFMLLTYMWALGLVSPNHVYYRIRKLGYVLVGTWSFLLLVVGLIQITRVVFWIRKKRGLSTSNSLRQNYSDQLNR